MFLCSVVSGILVLVAWLGLIPAMSVCVLYTLLCTLLYIPHTATTTLITNITAHYSLQLFQEYDTWPWGRIIEKIWRADV